MSDADDNDMFGKQIEAVAIPEQQHAALTMQAHLPRLLEIAVTAGPQGVEALRQLVALQQQLEDREARRAFATAFAAFQAACPRIKKTSTGEIVTKAGIKFFYAYADLSEIETTVRPHLARHGFSYRFEPGFVDAQRVSSACVLLHVGGHSERATIQMPTEVATSAMNPQQRNGNADSYCKRYALTSVLGLVSCDPDSDAADPADAEPITPDQVVELEALLDRCPAGTRGRFLGWLGVATMEEIRAVRFEACRAKLREKAQ